MPVSFLTEAQRESYGRYVMPPSSDDLARYFYISDDDRLLIARRRGSHNKLGFALQLTTVRYLGTFLEDPLDVPDLVLKTIAQHLGITELDNLNAYRFGEQRWEHSTEIRIKYSYSEITDPIVGFRLMRWLYGLCWSGTDRPSVLFDRCKIWMLTHKILLPGISILERLVSRVRSRVENRLWTILTKNITREQRQNLENLMTIPEGSRVSVIEKLRSGPVRVSGPALVQALLRLKTIRDMGIVLPPTTYIPPVRLTSIARFASTAKVTAIYRLPPIRRLATLVAFIHCLEAKALDDALDVLDMLLQGMFRKAVNEDKKKRFRTLKDLDRFSIVLATTCKVILDTTSSDDDLHAKVFSHVSREDLLKAVVSVEEMVRPNDDVYYNELEEHFRSVRRYLPTLLKTISFDSNSAGKPVVDAFAWLRENEQKQKNTEKAPREVIRKPWKPYVINEDGTLDHRAYTFCVLDELHKALRRRDIFMTPSWRYADPRAGLLKGDEWESVRPVICRTLGLLDNPKPVIDSLAKELDQTYRTVAARLSNNAAVKFEFVDGKNELILSPLEKMEEPQSLTALRKAVADRLPRVDLPEILLEIAARTNFSESFTHITERTTRADGLTTSLCAVLLAEACNTGIEPLVCDDIHQLKRDRLSWVDQNYIRDETLRNANAQLVAAQNQIALARIWGGGEVASADGMRFVVPVRTVHAGPNPKYFGVGRGVTWYNLISDQFSGLNAITVPGTLRDSLVLLAVVLDQQTELQPTQIMTDTGAYSDVIFGLFRLLGYRFSPRLADVGGTRFWRIDATADYGELNNISSQKINTHKIMEQWDDLLCLVGSLKLGRVPATGIMRTLQIGDRPTALAKALAEFGRIEKTLHTLNYINNEDIRRSTLIQLNRGEARHSLARAVFHGKRGELYQRYREGQEDQLSALGLVVNMIVLWNTIYIDAVIQELQKEGKSVRDEDAARLSPLVYDHVNMLGRYSFDIPDSVVNGGLRPLHGSLDK